MKSQKKGNNFLKNRAYLHKMRQEHKCKNNNWFFEQIS